MEKKISGVYKIENMITGDFYIGSSKNVKQRWVHHKAPSTWKQKPNNPMYKDMQKYRVENFEFTLLCEVEPGQLTVMEQKMNDELFCPNKTKTLLLKGLGHFFSSFYIIFMNTRQPSSHTLLGCRFGKN